MSTKQQTECAICGTRLRPLLDLGRQAMANALIETRTAPFTRYPLRFGWCPGCTHGQLLDFADPEDIFVDYLYASGTSQTLRAFFDWFAGAVVSSLGRDITVLELASNDGCLLDAFRDHGVSAIGVDPAKNLCKVAEDKGHNILCGFFPDVRPAEPVDLIVAMNVIAHTPNPRGFMAGVADALRPGGIALIQTSQAHMIENGEFDTIYHEHYSFYSVRSMEALARTAGLSLQRFDLVSVHGTSFVFALRKSGEAEAHVTFEGDFLVSQPPYPAPMLRRDVSDADAAAAYTQFTDTAIIRMTETRELLEKYRAKGFRVGLLGVAAKALTFINAAGIVPDLFLDEAPLKIGRFVPGADRPIEPLRSLLDMDHDVVLLIGAWNFADELAAKVRATLDESEMAQRVVLVVHQPNLRVL